LKKIWIKMTLILAIGGLFLTACGNSTNSIPATETDVEPTNEVSNIAELAAQPAITTVLPTATEPADMPPPDPTLEPTATAEREANTAQANQGEVATATPEPTYTPTSEPTPTPTEVVDWLTVSGKIEGGYNYLGNPDAPITMIDFSDFL